MRRVHISRDIIRNAGCNECLLSSHCQICVVNGGIHSTILSQTIPMSTHSRDFEPLDFGLSFFLS